MVRTIVGLDLGQARDHTAITVLTSSGTQGASKPPVYAVPYLARLPLGLTYPEIVAQVVTHARRPELRGAVWVADASGVGMAVVDQLALSFRGIPGSRLTRYRIYLPSTAVQGTEFSPSLLSDANVDKNAFHSSLAAYRLNRVRNWY